LISLIIYNKFNLKSCYVIRIGKERRNNQWSVGRARKGGALWRRIKKAIKNEKVRNPRGFWGRTKEIKKTRKIRHFCTSIYSRKKIKRIQKKSTVWKDSDSLKMKAFLKDLILKKKWRERKDSQKNRFLPKTWKN